MAWGSLSIALKQVLTAMSTQTIVWYRFTIATLILFILLGLSKKLPKLSQFNRYYMGLLVFGVIGMACNFALFNYSLKFVEPSVTQIFSHLSSFAMLLCGVIIFKEKLGIHQKIGLLIVILGLCLFFNDNIADLLTAGNYLFGVILSIGAALIWVAYGLAQKLMLRQFSSQQVLLLMYFWCAVVFTPVADFPQIQTLNGLTLICFIYCCCNTLIGYGAYAEALNRWEVAKVSVVITLVPLFTIIFSHLAHFIQPHFFAKPQLNMISYVGAIIVVLGAIISAIGHKFIKHKKI